MSELLQTTPLPTRTHAMLMRHYERIGEFAKAEDALFAMLDLDPEKVRLMELGIAFYQRLLAQTDAVLNEGNLPRREAEEGFAEIQLRRRQIKSNFQQP